MSNQKLNEKLETLNPKKLFKWLSWIMAFGTGITAFVFIFYFMNFTGELTTEHERWGTFGDFVGGKLNPLLSFLGLLALLLTVVLQNRQIEISSNELELSRKELEATRDELRRSATAQEKTEAAQVKQAKALEISAKISAITKLLEQDAHIIRSISSYTAGSLEEQKRKSADASYKEFQQELRRLYEELTSLDSAN